MARDSSIAREGDSDNQETKIQRMKETGTNEPSLARLNPEKEGDLLERNGGAQDDSARSF
ncbi:hypothetical protein [Candidatus Nitrospira neomarina]|uniref:Uncharacterized protein n=1 Tax=Candidatus Nitrospira neomarina TaxID=3020899 RepID=A0AA96JVU5_9BACT|nr:hypothetical protein [Candidatus Nitrospira neomarina]WNM62157.1 hypothetical protein PQG83_20825 [Candidatus Nitrospira neomarina]